MADPDHIDVVRQGKVEIDAWTARNPNSFLDLSEADFSGFNLNKADLRHADLRGARLAGAKLRGARLGGASLGEADLSDADLTEASLVESDLTQANLTRATVDEADLSQARLREAILRGTHLIGARLVGANLCDAQLSHAILSSADLSGANLHRTIGDDSKLEGATLQDAHLSEAQLRSVDLSGATLTGASLDGANLEEADLSGADLTNADLSEARLLNANLRGAEFVNAVLRGVDLQGAVLDEAEFTGADLSEVLYSATASPLPSPLDAAIINEASSHTSGVEESELPRDDDSSSDSPPSPQLRHLQDKVRELLDLVGGDWSFDSAEEQARLARTRKALLLAAALLDAAEPELLTATNITHIVDGLRGVRHHLHAFPEKTAWDRLDASSDALLDALAELPRPLGPEDAEAASALIRRAGEQAERTIERVSKKHEEQAGRHEALAQAINQAEKRLQAFDQLFEKQKGRMDEVIEGQQKAADASRSQQAGAFQDYLKDLTTRFEKHVNATVGGSLGELKGRRAELEQHIDDAKTDAEERLDEIKQLKKEAEQLVQVIGVAGLTSRYHETADKEASVANRFRWIAIGAFGAAIIAVGLLVWSLNPTNYSWDYTLFRFLAAAVILPGAFYCASESRRHRRLEHRNRRIELELASLKPFVAALPQAKQDEIIEALSNRYFGQEAPVDEESQLMQKLKNLKASELIKIMKEIQKLIPGK